jgi:hypothetical protein
MSRTEEIVIRERQFSPCATTVQIAFIADVTPERVRQILSAHGLPTRHWKQRDYICNNCGVIFSIGHGKPRQFCTPECRKDYLLATIECDVCGRLFQIPYSKVRTHIMKGYPRFYCSKQCFGRYIGNKYGLAVHPEFIGRRRARQPRKWDKFAEQIKELLEKGWTLIHILQKLGIPVGSFGSIKKMLVEKGLVPNSDASKSQATFAINTFSRK